MTLVPSAFHTTTMAFAIFYRGIPIGYSELEHFDDGMGVAIGQSARHLHTSSFGRYSDATRRRWVKPRLTRPTR
jgi:hypothetical protein